MAKDLYAPRSFPLQSPTTKEQMHGQVYSPPVFNQIGGLNGVNKITKSKFGLTTPGNVKKVL